MLKPIYQHKLFSPALFTLAYFVLSLWGILHHEIWLDEAHSFTIARDSASFLDLIQTSRQEGHPMLWYMMLWLLIPFTHDVFYMQLLHICITTLSVFLLLKYAPFNRIKQLLFAFSYFFFYEYNIISRNYALCILWVTIYCILVCKNHKHYPLIACALFLLANTHFLGLLISIPLAFSAYLLFQQEEHSLQLKKVASISMSILLAGLILGILQVLPQEDSVISHMPRPGYLSAERFRVFSVVFKAFYQFPDVSNPLPWNSNQFTVNKTAGTILTLLFPFVLLKAFGSKPLSLMIVLFSSLAISLFFYTGLMYNFTVRHWGFIFLSFYVAVWLQDGIKQDSYKKYLTTILFPALFVKENKWITQGLIYSTLIVQTAAAIYFYRLDLQRNFCNSQEAAYYIKQHHYDKNLIILSGFPAGAAVSAYLDKRLYYPEYKNYGSYGLWNISTWQVSKEELLRQLHQLYIHNKAYLLLDWPAFSNKHTTVFKDSTLQIQYLTSFKDGMIKNERFDLYEVTYLKK